MKIFCSILLLLAAALPIRAQLPSSPSQAEITPVSLITLVVNGSSYNRRQITVAGYLELTGSDWLLYVSAEHAEAKDLSSAIKVVGGPNMMAAKGGWVRLAGEYHRQSPSSKEPWAGTLEGATVP